MNKILILLITLLACLYLNSADQLNHVGDNCGFLWSTVDSNNEPTFSFKVAQKEGDDNYTNIYELKLNTLIEIASNNEAYTDDSLSFANDFKWDSKTSGDNGDFYFEITGFPNTLTPQLDLSSVYMKIELQDWKRQCGYDFNLEILNYTFIHEASDASLALQFSVNYEGDYTVNSFDDDTLKVKDGSIVIEDEADVEFGDEDYEIDVKINSIMVGTSSNYAIIYQRFDGTLSHEFNFYSSAYVPVWVWIVISIGFIIIVIIVVICCYCIFKKCRKQQQPEIV
eukprot:TRINITY_DN628_c0_g2_i1.p1 TRINITY_DN628_c0_g2~~TRINITY_DN628_c0_g2_i1.p1  ORF type:complete len:282 (+),score=95.70 TRINITY_DN628_c0_g2_i1:177-1022(+)